MKTLISVFALISISWIGHLTLDIQLRDLIRHNAIDLPALPAKQDDKKVELGQKLFYDKILSGNKDISCATCHHPQLASGDELVLPIGVGGIGLGTDRVIGEGREFVPRNSPEIFNRGDEKWHTMFWDGRVEGNAEEGFITPADEKLPPDAEFDNILAVQAMFPVTSRDEMRGEIGDLDIDGNVNELALISNAAPQSVWMAIMRRLLSLPEYVELFHEVYPEIPTTELGFQHAANAIAAYEIEAFTAIDSPWDRYLLGDDEALSTQQKEGAILFYDELKCAECHSGNLMTDQEYHNIGIPQFGPGKDFNTPIDPGRYAESGSAEDRFAFRTPPLRNVEVTGPWMHNGAYQSLEDAVLHHLDVLHYLDNYNEGSIPQELRNSFQDDDEVNDRIIATLDENLQFAEVDEQKIESLISFLEALTDSSPTSSIETIPSRVPSGLLIDK